MAINKSAAVTVKFSIRGWNQASNMALMNCYSTWETNILLFCFGIMFLLYEKNTTATVETLGDLNHVSWFGLPTVHHLHRRGAEQFVRQEVNFLHYVGKSYGELLSQKHKGCLLTRVDWTCMKTVIEEQHFLYTLMLRMRPFLPCVAGKQYDNIRFLGVL